MTQRLWRIKLTSPHINANDRPHWAVRNRMVQDLKNETHINCLALKIPNLTGHCEVQLEYIPKAGNGPDPDNLWPTDKACIDGLQAAGVLTNDRQQDVTRNVPHVAKADRRVVHQLILTITDLGVPNA